MGNFDVNLAYLGDDYFINLMLRNNLKFHNNKGAIQVDLGYDILITEFIGMYNTLMAMEKAL